MFYCAKIVYIPTQRASPASKVYCFGKAVAIFELNPNGTPLKLDRTSMIFRFSTFFLLGFVLVGISPADAQDAIRLEATGNNQWFRGNMHTHSHWSDGDDYLEMIALWYKERNYQFLVFTDHNVLANTERWEEVAKTKGGAEAYGKLKIKYPQLVHERINKAGKLEIRLRKFDEVSEQFNEAGKFLLVQGEEISDKFDGEPIHLNVSNVVEVIPPMTGTGIVETIQSNVRAVIAQRERTGQPMIVHLNHPNFGYAVTAEELMQVIGEKFFEVYNGHPAVRNSGNEEHAGTERVWDIVLTKRLAELELPIMYGLATDDGHEYHEIPNRKSNPGRGWVNVLTKELSADALIDSLEAGHFYSSSGVALKSIQTSVDGMSIEVDPVEGETYKIEFIGTRKGYDAASHPVLDKDGKVIRATRRYSADIGETFTAVDGTKASYKFKGDEIYLRARVTSSAKHPNPAEEGEFQRAWAQPIVGPGLK